MASNENEKEEEDEHEQDENNTMTMSYHEITEKCLKKADEAGLTKAEEAVPGVKKRPDSLVYEETTAPHTSGGKPTKTGQMTHFVAEDLEYKIKLSSPVSRNCESGSGTPINPMSRQFFNSSSQIDSQNVLDNIEYEAKMLASSVDNLTENLCNILHSISSITVDNVEIYRCAVNKLTDTMDSNIKSMYTIMAKTEEMAKAMQPATQLASRIREIKRLVDLFESNL